MSSAGPQRTLVVVNGPPGSGKSTIAEQLAEELGVALVGKDPIKEQLWDTIPRPEGIPEEDWTKQLGGAAFDVLWTVAGTAGPIVLVEAPFEADHAVAKARAVADRIIEVHITGDPEVLQRRYEERRPDRHPCHEAVPAPTAEDLEGHRPLGIGPVFTVDTTGDDDPYPEVLAWVRQELGRR